MVVEVKRSAPAAVLGVVVVAAPASVLAPASCNNGIEIDSKIRSRYAIIIQHFRFSLT